MEGADLTTAPAWRRLHDEPWAFGFFQAVRLLERRRTSESALGGFEDPAREAVRFTVPATLSHPPSEIAGLEAATNGPARLSVAFLGLTGPVGVLPHHYTEITADRRRAKDPVLGDFLDLFHHRLLSLFYRAWAKSRPPVGLEAGAGDRLGPHLDDLMGLVPLQAAPADDGIRAALRYYAGLFASTQRSADALRAMLTDYFDVPVEVVQFVGAWYPVPQSQQCRLDDDDLAASRLDGSAPVGDEIWEQQSRVRLRIGPLPWARFREFLPTGSAHAALAELTRQFGGDAYDFEVQLVLDRQDAPGTHLDADRDTPATLGWGTWLRTRPATHDPDDTIFALTQDSAA